MILVIRMAKHTPHPVPHSCPTDLRQRQELTCLSHWYLDFSSNFLRHCLITLCSDIPVFAFPLIPIWYSLPNSHHAIICQQLLSRASMFLLFPCTSTCNLVCNNTPSQDHHLPPVQTLCSTVDSQFSSICPTLAFYLSYQQTFVCSRVCICLDTIVWDFTVILMCQWHSSLHNVHSTEWSQFVPYIRWHNHRFPSDIPHVHSYNLVTFSSHIYLIPAANLPKCSTQANLPHLVVDPIFPQYPISIYNTRSIFEFIQQHTVVVSTDPEVIANH